MCAAIVLFEKDNAHFIKSIFELSDITEVGPAECVDRLIGVTDNTHVLVASREAQNYLVLRNVRVLVFVNHDVLESILIRSQHVGMHAEQTHDIDQEVIKIHGSGLDQTLLVFAVNLGVFAIKNMRGLFGGLRGRHQFVLPI